MRGLIERARDWANHDPDPDTKTELLEIVERVVAGDEAAATDLRSRFSGPLAFGTAGLRGPVAAGESRMNVAVVTRATAGLAQHLIDMIGKGGRVVVGCDARYGSHAFYEAATEVLSGAGLTALALPKERPTPLTAYAVRALDADAGIMVTASHNPPADNGYKVYLGGRATDEDGRGVQIVPPADAEIAACIATAPAADEVPRSTDGIQLVGDDLIEAYVARMASHRRSSAPSKVRVVLTAMHGVGGEIAQAVLQRAQVNDIHPVPEQIEPDHDFPTVGFPNPEEPGAIDLSIALATEVSADLVVALDPDADRCSLAIPVRDGGWRQLTGDEIGVLLGEQAASDDRRAGDALACSIVSSRLLGQIAELHGLRRVSTLTGFKWIARTPGIRFGYEEAIGYCTDPEAVRDKDGIGAMTYAVSLVEELAEQGKTVEDLLDDLARTHGLHASSPLTFRVSDLSIITESMAKLRGVGLSELAGSPVTETVDLAAGADGLPPTDGLRYVTEAADRVVIRPSGTEPKLKCYLEVILPCDGNEVPHAAARERLEQIKSDLHAVLGL
ncbi:MAG: phospho-sugar mutase [Microlunatus sp.]|nr:phospho-sugar mutase [Microlunatus sp.]